MNKVILGGMALLAVGAAAPVTMAQDMATGVEIGNTNANVNTNTATATVIIQLFDDDAILDALAAIQADLHALPNLSPIPGFTGPTDNDLGDVIETVDVRLQDGDNGGSTDGGGNGGSTDESAFLFGGRMETPSPSGLSFGMD